MTAQCILNDGFTANTISCKEAIWSATLHVTVSFQLIVHGNIKITKRYYRTKRLITSRDGPVNGTEKSRDETQEDYRATCTEKLW